MTKLEEEIWKSLIETRFEMVDKQISALSEISRKYIRLALDYSWSGDMDKLSAEQLEELYTTWEKENGIL